MSLLSNVIKGGNGDLFNPGRERFWVSPGNHYALGPASGAEGGYNAIIEACIANTWPFGTSTGTCNIATGSPSRVAYADKSMVLRSFRCWSGGSGRLRLQDWESKDVIMVLRLEPGLSLSLVLGPDGVDIGRAPHWHWVSNAGSSERCWVETVYDIA